VEELTRSWLSAELGFDAPADQLWHVKLDRAGIHMGNLYKRRAEWFRQQGAEGDTDQQVMVDYWLKRRRGEL
jgi:hypothetical protein